jgi:hypothetical protein
MIKSDDEKLILFQQMITDWEETLKVDRFWEMNLFGGKHKADPLQAFHVK